MRAQSFDKLPQHSPLVYETREVRILEDTYERKQQTSNPENPSTTKLHQ